MNTRIHQAMSVVVLAFAGCIGPTDYYHWAAELAGVGSTTVHSSRPAVTPSNQASSPTPTTRPAPSPVNSCPAVPDSPLFASDPASWVIRRLDASAEYTVRIAEGQVLEFIDAEGASRTVSGGRICENEDGAWTTFTVTAVLTVGNEPDDLELQLTLDKAADGSYAGQLKATPLTPDQRPGTSIFTWIWKVDFVEHATSSGGGGSGYSYTYWILLP